MTGNGDAMAQDVSAERQLDGITCAADLLEPRCTQLFLTGAFARAGIPQPKHTPAKIFKRSMTS